LSRQLANDAIDEFSVPNSRTPRGAPSEEKKPKRRGDDEMKPDSEYARGRRTGKMVTRDCD
jgi:hypothetical protein